MHMQLAIWEEESNASVEQSEMSLWPVAGQMLVHNTVALPLAAVNSKGNSEMKHQKKKPSPHYHEGHVTKYLDFD